MFQCTDFSLCRLLLLQTTGSRHGGFSSCSSWAQGPGSVVVTHRPSCFVAWGILDQRSNPPVSPALAGRFLSNAPPGKSKRSKSFTLQIKPKEDFTEVLSSRLPLSLNTSLRGQLFETFSQLTPLFLVLPFLSFFSPSLFVP